jgi:hypothetical protein
VTVITKGRISMSPATIVTTLSLDELLEAVSLPALRYGGKIPSSGWGATDPVNDDYLGSHTTRPTPGVPIIAPEGELHERYIEARYYYDDYDQRAAEYAQLAPGTAVPEFQLRAVDVMISETSVDDEYLLFVSAGSTVAGYKSQILQGIEAKLQEQDPALTIHAGSQSRGFGDDDFFFWLLHRVTNSNQITDELSVSVIRDLSGQDALSRPSSVSQGASVDRPELLSMIARRTSTFGPAKFACYFEPLTLHLDLDLRQDGAFLLQLGNSWYEKDAPLPSLFRTHIVRDAAYTVLPALRSAYYGDSAWRTHERDQFITKAITDLADVVAKLQASLAQKLSTQP